MDAIRCSGQTRGFRVGAHMFAYHEWTLVPAATDEQRACKMLTILEGVDGPADVRLAPFKAAGTPVHPPTVEELAKRIAEMEERLEDGASGPRAIGSEDIDKLEATVAEGMAANEAMVAKIAELEESNKTLTSQIADLSDSKAARETNIKQLTARVKELETAQAAAAAAVAATATT